MAAWLFHGHLGSHWQPPPWPASPRPCLLLLEASVQHGARLVLATLRGALTYPIPPTFLVSCFSPRGPPSTRLPRDSCLHRLLHRRHCMVPALRRPPSQLVSLATALGGVPACVTGCKGVSWRLVPTVARGGGVCGSAVGSASPATAAGVMVWGRCSTVLGDWPALVSLAGRQHSVPCRRQRAEGIGQRAEGSGSWSPVPVGPACTSLTRSQEGKVQKPGGGCRMGHRALGKGRCPHREFPGLADPSWVR